MEWWRTHKFEDKELESERQTRLICEENSRLGQKTVLRDKKLRENK